MDDNPVPKPASHPDMELSGGVPETENKEQSETIDVLLQRAADGDERAQVKVGRYYLKRSSVEEPETGQATAKQGVSWFCRASRQGSEDATQELRDALEKELGVTEDNLDEVKWCINTTALEKSARNAAKGLFKAINPLSTDTSLLDSLNKQERKLIEKALKSSKTGEVDEDIFVEKIMKRFHGSGGLTLDALLQSNVEMEAFNNASWLKKITRYPGKLINVFADNTIEAVGRQGTTWLVRLIPTNQIYMVIAFFIYSLITLDLILWFIPLVCFYVSYFVMTVSTMQMFYTRRKKKDVSTIANLLSRFNDALDNESAESAYDWDKLTPYMSYFSSLFFMVGSFAVSDHTWIPCSELVCVSAFFCVTCFYALSDTYDFLLFLSIGLDFVSTLPTFIEALPNIPVVKSLLILVAGNVYSIPIFPGLSLNLGIPSLASLVVPVIFVKMAMDKSWQGWYRILIPHLVCFFWWQVTALLFRHCTWLGLLRASVGWLSFLILLPIVSLMFFIYFLIYLLRVMTFSNFLRIVVTVILLALPIAVGLLSRRGFNLGRLSFMNKPWIKYSVFVFVFAVMFSAMFLIPPLEKDVEGNFITWDQYKRFCSKPQWDKSNMADAQIQCSHLKYSIVEWEGIVKKVTVKETHNQAEDFLSYLPLSISDWVKCAYGEKYPACDTIEDAAQREMCELILLQGHHSCHLKRLDIYKFEILVQMPIDEENSVDVKVQASNWFKSALMNISEGDSISFRASLTNNIGNFWPELNLYYLKSESRGVDYGSKTSLSETSWRVVEYIRRGAYTIWNFFLAPLFEFK